MYKIKFMYKQIKFTYTNIYTNISYTNILNDLHIHYYIYKQIKFTYTNISYTNIYTNILNDLQRDYNKKIKLNLHIHTNTYATRNNNKYL